MKSKKNNKFLEVYNSFTVKEKSEFSKFTRIGLRGKTRNYRKILSSLKTNEKGITELDVSKNERTRWNRLSELSILADKFLVYKSTENNNTKNKLALLKEYDKRNLHSYFISSYTEMLKDISFEHIVNFDYNMFYRIYKMQLYQRRSMSDTKLFIKKFSGINTMRTGAYLIEKLEVLIEIWNLKVTENLDIKAHEEEIFKEINIEKIIKIFSENPNSPDNIFNTLKFLYNMYLSLSDPEADDYYPEARRIFFRNLKTISKEKRSVYYGYMIDLILERANKSGPGAMEELFYLINNKFSEGTTDDIEYVDIPVNKFRDYIFVAVCLGKFRWAASFVKKYGDLLPPEIRDENLLIAEALIFYHKKNYIKCYESLNKIRKNNPFTYVDVTVLKLKVMYELKKFDQCHDVLKNFKEYLRKERIVQDHLKVYALEFCRDFNLLLKYKQNPLKGNLLELEYRLSKFELIGKKWIFLKMSQLKVS